MGYVQFVHPDEPLGIFLTPFDNVSEMMACIIAYAPNGFTFKRIIL